MVEDVKNGYLASCILSHVTVFRHGALHRSIPSLAFGKLNECFDTFCFSLLSFIISSCTKFPKYYLAKYKAMFAII